MGKKIKGLLLLTAVITAGYTGYEMKSLLGDKLLWENLSFFFLISLWCIIVLGLSFLKKQFNHHYFLLSTISGLLLSIGFPGLIPFPIFMFVGLVPLLMIEHFIAKEGEKKSGRRFFWYAFNTFVLYNIITTWWVANSALAPGIFANTVNSLLAAIPLVLYHKTRNKIPNLAGMAFIAFFITYEFNHFHWDLSWPWLALGNGFGQVPSWVQWYEFTGVFGGSLWVLGVNYLIYQLWAAYTVNRQWDRKQIIVIATILLLPLVLSQVMYYGAQDKGAAVQVAVVQPSYEPHYKKFTIPEQDQIKHYIKLAASVVDEQTDFLILPETSFGYVDDRKIASYPAIQELEIFAAQYPRLKIITGLSAFHEFKEGEPKVGSIREQKLRNGKVRYLETYNYAVQLPLDEVPQAHKKSKLVPGAEIFPFKSVLFMFESLVDALGGTLAGNGTEEIPQVFENEKANIAPLICYESIYGGYVAGFVRNGADLLVVMTNDSWWGNTAGHRQHLYFSSLRAIENRKGVARAANSGISAFINQRGDIIASTTYDTATALQHTLHVNNERTFYSNWGDLIARICLFLSIILVLNLISKTLIKERIEPEEN